MAEEILNSANWTKATSCFTDKQKIVITNVLETGFWGDCDMSFGSKEKADYAHGFFTNETNCEFKGKQLSGIFSGIAKVLKETKSEYFLMISDWWQDGSGDMLFVNMEMFKNGN